MNGSTISCGFGSDVFFMLGSTHPPLHTNPRKDVQECTWYTGFPLKQRLRGRAKAAGDQLHPGVSPRSTGIPPSVLFSWAC